MNDQNKKNEHGLDVLLARAFAQRENLTGKSNETNTPESNESGWHPAFDPDFLNSLQTGIISVEERQTFLQHLFECNQCRELILLHMRSGILFGESDEDEHENKDEDEHEGELTPVSSDPVLHRQTGWAFRELWSSRAIVAAATILLVIVGIAFRFVGQSEMSLARKEFLEQIDHHESNRFSARLSDCGYRLSGGSYMKSVGSPNVDTQPDPMAIAYAKLSSEEKKDPELVLRYAQFLLMEKKDAETAITVLAAVPNDSENTEIDMLRGLAEFFRNNDGQAQIHFRKVLDKKYDETATLNLAISLTRSRQFEKARPLFQKVAESTTSESLKLQIESFLKKKASDD
ncbi:MAG: hypothetical protein PHQ75_09905 [Thermoguttaceae bacterium]|nr:hypothetical protein [Thermoguttaceae bacterium]